MQNVYDSQNEFGVTKSRVNLGHVFGYMFAGLLVSGLIALATFLLIGTNETALEMYTPAIYISAISLFFITIGSQFALRRNSTVGSAVCFALYSIAMGILLSMFMICYDLAFLGYIFLATAACFGVMALYGAISKKSVMTLGMICSGLLVGCLILALVNMFLGSSSLYYIISFVSLAAMLGFTAYDVNWAKRASDSGEMTHALAIYMALQIYTDFIYIFIRLVVILGRNRR